MWSQKQIVNHTEAAKKLGIIKGEVAEFLVSKKDITERDAITFIKKRYRAHGLVNDDKKYFAIVAFGKNTSEVHYFPKGEGLRLKQNTLILLDMWARLDKNNAPYADMTWMFWYGKKVPAKIQSKWKTLIASRTSTLTLLKLFLKKWKLPRGLDLDRVAHDVIGNAGYGNTIKHTVGHSLGFDSPHGKLPGINWKEYKRLAKNVGYTIEPGMYFKDFGMRTEIDFYINSKSAVVITTALQKDIDVIAK